MGDENVRQILFTSFGGSPGNIYNRPLSKAATSVVPSFTHIINTVIYMPQGRGYTNNTGKRTTLGPTLIDIGPVT